MSVSSGQWSLAIEQAKLNEEANVPETEDFSRSRWWSDDYSTSTYGLVEFLVEQGNTEENDMVTHRGEIDLVRRVAKSYGFYFSCYDAEEYLEWREKIEYRPTNKQVCELAAEISGMSEETINDVLRRLRQDDEIVQARVGNDYFVYPPYKDDPEDASAVWGRSEEQAEEGVCKETNNGLATRRNRRRVAPRPQAQGNGGGDEQIGSGKILPLSLGLLQPGTRRPQQLEAGKTSNERQRHDSRRCGRGDREHTAGKQRDGVVTVPECPDEECGYEPLSSEWGLKMHWKMAHPDKDPPEEVASIEMPLEQRNLISKGKLEGFKPDLETPEEEAVYEAYLGRDSTNFSKRERAIRSVGGISEITRVIEACGYSEDAREKALEIYAGVIEGVDNLQDVGRHHDEYVGACVYYSGRQYEEPVILREIASHLDCGHKRIPKKESRISPHADYKKEIPRPQWYFDKMDDIELSDDERETIETLADRAFMGGVIVQAKIAVAASIGIVIEIRKNTKVQKNEVANTFYVSRIMMAEYREDLIELWEELQDDDVLEDEKLEMTVHQPEYNEKT